MELTARQLVTARLAGGLLTVTGAAYLLRPRQVGVWAAGGGAVPLSAVVRLLGARQFMQGVLIMVAPQPKLLRIGVAVDALHAASMLAVPLLWPDHRRAAAISASVAAAAATLSTAALVGGG